MITRNELFAAREADLNDASDELCNELSRTHRERLAEYEQRFPEHPLPASERTFQGLREILCWTKTHHTVRHVKDFDPPLYLEARAYQTDERDAMALYLDRIEQPKLHQALEGLTKSALLKKPKTDLIVQAVRLGIAMPQVLRRWRKAEIVEAIIKYWNEEAEL